MFGLKNDEILTYLLLIVVGYCIAKMFSRSCNGFSVGGQTYLKHFPSSDDPNNPGCDTTAWIQKSFDCCMNIPNPLWGLQKSLLLFSFSLLVVVLL